MEKVNSFTFKCALPNGTIKEKIIYSLNEGEERNYLLLGTGHGVSIAYCLFMGSKHKENFWERVAAYKMIPNGQLANALGKATGDCYMSVQFFEEIPPAVLEGTKNSKSRITPLKHEPGRGYQIIGYPRPPKKPNDKKL